MNFSTQEPTSSTPAASSASASALLGRSNISNIQTPHSGQSSMSMTRSILTPASIVEDPDDIDRLTTMKAWKSVHRFGSDRDVAFVKRSCCILCN